MKETKKTSKALGVRVASTLLLSAVLLQSNAITSNVVVRAQQAGVEFDPVGGYKLIKSLVTDQIITIL